MNLFSETYKTTSFLKIIFKVENLTIEKIDLYFIKKLVSK